MTDLEIIDLIADRDRYKAALEAIVAAFKEADNVGLFDLKATPEIKQRVAAQHCRALAMQHSKPKEKP